MVIAVAAQAAPFRFAQLLRTVQSSDTAAPAVLQTQHSTTLRNIANNCHRCCRAGRAVPFRAAVAHRARRGRGGAGGAETCAQPHVQPPQRADQPPGWCGPYHIHCCRVITLSYQNRRRRGTDLNPKNPKEMAVPRHALSLMRSLLNSDASFMEGAGFILTSD